MSGQKIDAVAARVPTTLDELAECGISKTALRQYGERLLASVRAHIEMHRLHEYVENGPQKEDPRATAARR